MEPKVGDTVILNVRVSSLATGIMDADYGEKAKIIKVKDEMITVRMKNGETVELEPGEWLPTD